MDDDNELFVSQIILENFKDMSEDEINQKIDRIKKDYTVLLNIKEKLKKYLEVAKVSESSQLAQILNHQSDRLNVNKINTQDMKNIGGVIFQAYEIVPKLLEELGLISNINYVIYYNGYRLDNCELNPETDLNYEIHRNNLVLRIRKSAINAKKKLLEQNTQLDAIAKHYKDFISPLKKVEEKSKTGWKVNYGYAAEAFERHWEQIGHQLEDAPFNDNLREGEIWHLYILSSGNAPFYTGPDTAQAQVKAANASIVSNANTVMDALNSVIQLCEEKAVGSEAYTNLYKQYKDAFTAKESKITTINKKLWESLEDTIQEELIKDFGEIASSRSQAQTKNKAIYIR